MGARLLPRAKSRVRRLGRPDDRRLPGPEAHLPPLDPPPSSRPLLGAVVLAPPASSAEVEPVPAEHARGYGACVPPTEISVLERQNLKDASHRANYIGESTTSTSGVASERARIRR